MPSPAAIPTVPAFLSALPAAQRETLTFLHKAIRKAVPALKPQIMPGMGGPLIGYGKYHYKYPSGREGDWFLIGLAAGKSGYALHICSSDKQGYLVEQKAATLGKVKAGKSCINFKAIEDLNLPAALALVKKAEKAGGLGDVNFNSRR